MALNPSFIEKSQIFFRLVFVGCGLTNLTCFSLHVFCVVVLLINRYLSSSIMGEQLRLLKVIVVQGKRLVIRDFRSSDPYVVVKLGNQTAKTRVINCCLNPVWNEELSFTLTEPLRVLNLEVFDKDLLKADDKMGNTYLNLQPLLSAGRLKDILKVSSGETTLRKVKPDSENCLVRESSINCVNGEVVQNVWLRLRGVDSGELQLTIKLITSAASSI
ncbi:Protein C2-DOMAIN ABA-RELATED 11, partial [Mucuna pruriens]